MLDNLFQMVKEFGQSEVVDNPAVPNEHNNAVMSEASYAVAGTLQQAVANGNLGELMNMFHQGNDVMSNPLAQQAQGSFIESITKKLGIDSHTAAGLSGSLLPMIMNSLVKRTNSLAPQDSGFDLNSLIGSLTGGGGTGANTGGFDIGGLIKQFTGDEQQGGHPKSQQENSGLMDMIQGFFGK